MTPIAMSHSKSTEQEIVYLIDRNDRLSEVGGSWTQFAQANDCDAVMPDRVLGRPLWDFITDTHVRELYRRMIQRARDRHPVQFDYRCDAPECRRLFRMTIHALEEGSVEFVTRLLWQEPRPRVDMLDQKVPASGPWVRVCSWCEKVSLPNGVWAPVEEAAEKLGFLAEEHVPRLTHGICPPCHSSMLAQLEPMAGTSGRDRDIPNPIGGDSSSAP